MTGETGWTDWERVTRGPGYFAGFRCLAGECPHTCCAAGWEIPVDAETARFYRTLPGELGDRLRAALGRDEEGEVCLFPGEDGVCPFLDGAGLCEVHIRLGEERTCAICRSHPRFFYDYGPLREVGLCGSCPEAARLILNEDLSPTLSPGGGQGEAPELLPPLLSARSWAMAILERRELPLGRRLQAALLLANEVQVMVDNGDWEDLAAVGSYYAQEVPQVEASRLPGGEEALKACLEELGALEPLEPDWRGLLSAAAPRRVPPEKGRRAAAYFVYRHWLRGVWDGDLVSWAAVGAMGVLTAAAVGPDFDEGFRRFCLEIEHSEENLAALRGAFGERLGLARLLAAANLA